MQDNVRPDGTIRRVRAPDGYFGNLSPRHGVVGNRAIVDRRPRRDDHHALLDLGRGCVRQQICRRFEHGRCGNRRWRNESHRASTRPHRTLRNPHGRTLRRRGTPDFRDRLRERCRGRIGLNGDRRRSVRRGHNGGPAGLAATARYFTRRLERARPHKAESQQPRKSGARDWRGKPEPARPAAALFVLTDPGAHGREHRPGPQRSPEQKQRFVRPLKLAQFARARGASPDVLLHPRSVVWGQLLVYVGGKAGFEGITRLHCCRRRMRVAHRRNLRATRPGTLCAPCAASF